MKKAKQKRLGVTVEEAFAELDRRGVAKTSKATRGTIAVVRALTRISEEAIRVGDATTRIDRAKGVAR